MSSVTSSFDLKITPMLEGSFLLTPLLFFLTEEAPFNVGTLGCLI